MKIISSVLGVFVAKRNIFFIYLVTLLISSLIGKDFIQIVFEIILDIR